LIHLGSIGKTSIDVDISFLFVAALWVANEYQNEKDLKVALLWAPVLLISVLLHELAHAAMIAAFGYGSSQIVLSGMGGVTYNRRRARPWHDLLISVAGPASSFLLAFVAYYLFNTVPLLRHDAMLVRFMPILIWANYKWGLFNLIPVSPLDGGHVVRNFFRMFLRERTAFVISVWIALIVGVALVLLGIRSGQFFIALLLGWFVYMNFQQWQYFRTHGFPGD
jgi:stage IV sporulation protein FB